LRKVENSVLEKIICSNTKRHSFEIPQLHIYLPV